MTIKIKYPLTIFHKRKSQPYFFEDSLYGINFAHVHGATAIDLDCTVTKDKVMIVNHWNDILGRGGMTDPNNRRKQHGMVYNLDWERIKTFTAPHGGHIIRAVDAIKRCAELDMTPCFEVKGGRVFENEEIYKQILEASIKYNCPVIIMTLPHLGGRNRGYLRLAAAKRAGLHTMVLVNLTKYGRGQVPKNEWQHLDFVKGPLSWTRRSRPARVKRLGPGSKWGCSVSAGNARRMTRKLRKRLR